mgnify:FL=1
MFNVVLVEPEIPPNTGNIGRLCLATGATLHLVEPLGFRLDEKALRRAGLDYWDRVSVVRWRDWSAFDAARDRSVGMWYLTTKSRRAYWGCPFGKGDYLVFGRVCWLLIRRGA